ncbi:hypothetical protein HDF09_001742 [Edaphobacter lichenicola]|uniref:Uncharacterized protein n=1 Tax=Tunturiibacter empetritectus TaxID=3069691 RepID=A0A7W8IH75_9BACT|nr:hypothetical protein [Edaphobacter lichenicola]
MRIAAQRHIERRGFMNAEEKHAKRENHAHKSESLQKTHS